jgi:hypothetical protein
MKEFIKFMYGYYWNDYISIKASGRGTLVFCWVMLLIAVIGILRIII